MSEAVQDPSRVDAEKPPEWRAVYDENGVDRSLTRSFLRRTPTECLQLLDEMYEFVQGARVGKPVR